MEDYAAALLSEWIYNAAESQDGDIFRLPSDEQPDVTVHLEKVVRNDGRFQATFASASVLIDDVKHLYLIFKGTSELLEIATWNFSAPDWQAYGEEGLFAHPGAATFVNQFLYLKELTKLLQQQRWGMADRLILCGHSLGGMYATLLMRKIYKMLQTDQPDCGLDSPQLWALLQGARCATFGAPMVFGREEGAEFEAEFVEWMLARYRNYAYKNDLAPRAWSLDLDKFFDMSTAQARAELQGQVPTLSDSAAALIGEHPVKLGLGALAMALVSLPAVMAVAGYEVGARSVQKLGASQVPDLKEWFHSKPESESYARTASRYRHIGTVVVIRERESPAPHGDFLSFNLTGESVNDHQIGNYISALSFRALGKEEESSCWCSSCEARGMF